ncbi:MAG: hypothetical protein MJ101_04365 [Clostridia bacterium]|nr:hypothetical protein [Clostridia bacterium]
MKRILSLVFAVIFIISVCLASSSCMQLDELKERVAHIDCDNMTIEYLGSVYKKLPFDDLPFSVESGERTLYIVTADMPVLAAAAKATNGMLYVGSEFIRLHYSDELFADEIIYEAGCYGLYCKEEIYETTVADHSAPRDVLALRMERYSDYVYCSYLQAVSDEFIEMLENTLADAVEFDHDYGGYLYSCFDMYMCDASMSFYDSYGQICANVDKNGNVEYVLIDVAAANGKKLLIDNSYLDAMTPYLEATDLWWKDVKSVFEVNK